MARLSPIKFEMGYKIEFQTAIRGHHICKDVWVPLIVQELICKADNREEAIEYDKNAICVFKTGDPETLVGHLPIELSCLLKYFLDASPENNLIAVVTRKRKRGAGLVVPAKYVALTKNKTFASILLQKLTEKKRKHSNFEFDIITAIVASTPSCKI